MIISLLVEERDDDDGREEISIHESTASESMVPPCRGVRGRRRLVYLPIASCARLRRHWSLGDPAVTIDRDGHVRSFENQTVQCVKTSWLVILRAEAQSRYRNREG